MRWDMYYSNNVASWNLSPGSFRFNPIVSKNYYSGPSKDFYGIQQALAPYKNDCVRSSREKNTTYFLSQCGRNERRRRRQIEIFGASGPLD
jgi:hypothetical protein